MTRCVFAAALVMAFSVGCDESDADDTGPILVALDAGLDAALGGLNPYVTAHLPEDGDAGVLPESNILLLFSESMDPTAGTVELEPGDVLAAADGTWLRSSDLFTNPVPDRPDIAVILDPNEAMVGGVEHTVTVNGDFRDVAGALAFPGEPRLRFSFVVRAPSPPQVISCDPAEGSTVAASAVAELRCTFDQQMHAGLGTVVLTPSVLLQPTAWSADLRTATWVLDAPLADGTAYRLELRSFADRSGLPLDASAYLGDGALDFATAP